MLFIYCVLSYILGLSIFYFILDSLPSFLVFLTSLCSFIGMTFIFYFYKNHSLRIYFIIFLFIILGIINTSIHNYYNNTIILQQPLKGIYAYGEIYKIEQSSYNKANYVYLNNLIFNTTYLPKQNLKTTLLPNRIKVKYNGLLAVHDIVRGRFYLFPPSSALYPYGFSFTKNAFYKKISANGFVLGKLEIIDNFHQNNLYENLFIILNQLKQKVINDINQYAHSKTAPFLVAISIGETTFLPDDISNLRKTSLAHLISISGYHVSLITALLFISIRFLLVLLPLISLQYNIKKISAGCCIVALMFYGLLVGNHDPALRAIIMGTVILLGIILNFNVVSFNALFLAIFIILILKPYSIYSASFLLSSVATLGVITLWNNSYMQSAYLFSKKHWYLRVLFFIIGAMLTSLFVELLIAPILAFYFQEIPTVGIFANVIAEPIFAFLIMPSMIAYIFAPIIIGKYFIMVASFAMLIILKIASSLAHTSYSSLYTPFFPIYIMYSYLLALMFYTVMPRFRYIALALVIIMFVWYELKPLPDIIIEDSFNLVAFRGHNNKYILSNSNEKFISKIWFKDSNLIATKAIEHSSEFKCQNGSCIWEQPNKIISFNKSAEYYSEDCGAVDLILVNAKTPYKCSYGITVDKTYTAEHGASFIYFKKNKIVVDSNN